MNEMYYGYDQESAAASYQAQCMPKFGNTSGKEHDTQKIKAAFFEVRAQKTLNATPKLSSEAIQHARLCRMF